jgi:hypothetical protein
VPVMGMISAKPVGNFTLVDLQFGPLRAGALAVAAAYAVLELVFAVEAVRRQFTQPAAKDSNA